MNSEAAGTEWIRKADAQELVDIWRKYAGLRPRTGRTAMVGQCADELSEVIARNVQPSPDATLRQAREKWIGDEYRAARMPMAERDAFDAGWNAARPVPQPATAELVPCSKCRVVGNWRKIGKGHYCDVCWSKMQNPPRMKDSFEFYDKIYHPTTGNPPATWEFAEAYAKYCLELIAVPQPATEPDERWRKLAQGKWFFVDSPNCLERYSVQRRTAGGCSIVCSTPYHHDGAKRDMIEIARAHNAALALRDVPQGQTTNELIKGILLDTLFLLSSAHPASCKVGWCSCPCDLAHAIRQYEQYRLKVLAASSAPKEKG